MVKNNFELVKQKILKLKTQHERLRVVFVYNPRSSKAKMVNAEVLAPAREAFKAGITIIKYEVQPTNVDDNAKKLSEILQNGDAVVTAGGDGTATIGLNGAVLSEKDVYFWALPYGNFNDMARALFRADRILKCDERGRGAKRIDVSRSESRKFYPLEAKINEKHYRYSACYFTVGLFAESTELFDKKEVRGHLRKGKKSLIYSVWKLAGWYFKNKNREFLPIFNLSRRPIVWKKDGRMLSAEEEIFAAPVGTSDYLAVNGISVAKMMRGGEWYLAHAGFLSTTQELTKFWKLAGFMLRSIFVQIPGTVSSMDVIYFEKPSTIEIQAEGEYKKIEDVSKIEILKASNGIRIL